MQSLAHAPSVKILAKRHWGGPLLATASTKERLHIANDLGGYFRYHIECTGHGLFHICSICRQNATVQGASSHLLEFA